MELHALVNAQLDTSVIRLHGNALNAQLDAELALLPEAV